MPADTQFLCPSVQCFCVCPLFKTVLNIWVYAHYPCPCGLAEDKTIKPCTLRIPNLPWSRGGRAGFRVINLCLETGFGVSTQTPNPVLS
jgi:hypothetical protein